MTNKTDIAAIIVAAGRGTRAGPGLPKQWRDLGGRPVAVHAIEAFRRHPGIGRVVLVLHPDDMGLAAGWALHPDMQVVAGGADRRRSVVNGLGALSGDPPQAVLIHDAARPFVPADLIDRVIAALENHQAAAPALAVVDALWHGSDGVVSGTASRDGLYRAQTPQGFHYTAILSAHHNFVGSPADDVEVARASGLDVSIVDGDYRTFKITGPADFARAAMLLEAQVDIRTGNGFDVHAFGPGDAVTICGVAIPHDRALSGHSDADVGMHAVTDAIYGALAAGDIGVHFPPSDPAWRGAASEIFLAHAAGLARDQSFRVSHVDLTLICEMPKIGPHAPAMAAELARILGIDAGRVGVKATTSERLGFTGRGEGIAAMATATLIAGSA